ncbi:MAG: C39 family peptidase, partial [Kangiellaceae bacterium]|nr:C39 family peptidase [Kangiellaceae bacterium]
MELIQQDNVVTISDRIKQLAQSGCYLDAYRKATDSWGAINQWQTSQQLSSFIQLADRLGHSRCGDFLRLSLARKNRNNIDYQIRAGYLQLNRKGPFATWASCQELLSRSIISDVQRADIYLLQSLVSSSLRDFSSADQLIAMSGEINKDDWWHRVNAYVLTDKEQFNDAAAYLKQRYESNPSEHLLMQYSRALEQVANSEQVISLLSKEAFKYQSVRPWFSLAQLYKEVNSLDKTEYCLSKINEYYLGSDKDTEQRLSYLKGHVELSRKNYAGAQLFFQQCSDLFSKTVSENIVENSSEHSVRLNVPFVKQKYLTCAPASMSALLSYHGMNYSQDSIADKVCYDGTPDYLQYQWLDENSIPFIEFDLDWQLAQKLLDLDLPFTLVTHSGATSHMQVVTGYNAKTGILYLMDPSSAGVTELLANEATLRHAIVGPRCMVFLPNDKSDTVKDLVFPSRKAYLLSRKLNAHLRGHKIEDAKLLQEQMIAHDPEHRLTLIGSRNIALYLKDEQLIESTTKEVLNKFPNETWLISSRYYSLFALGRRNKGLDFLAEKISTNYHHELVECFILETYQDNNYRCRVKSYIPQLMRAAGYSAESNWVLGHWFWSNGRQSDARRCYRWALTLNDRDDRYSESFFKSALWNGSEEEVIEFLRQRWQEYRSGSSGPALSLYRALACTDKEAEGLEVLEQSLIERPNDDDLIEFYLKRLLEFAQYEKFDVMFEKSKLHLSKSSQLTLQADYYYAIDQHNKTESIYLKLIDDFPTERNYYDSLFSIMDARGAMNEIDKKLEVVLELVGFTPFAAWLHIDWHSSEQVKMEMLTKLVDLYPNDVDAVERLANKLVSNRQLIDAKSLLERTINESTRSADLLALLSQIELLNSNNPAALTFAKRAINLDIDSDDAFDALVSCNLGAKTRKIMLLEFFELIKKTTTNGDALWNFWHSASAWLSHDELNEFCDYIAKNYANLWQTPVIKAKHLVEQNLLAEAATILERAKSQFSLLPRVYFELAEVYQLSGNFEKSAENYRYVISLNPKWSMPPRRLADRLEKEGKLEESIKVLEKACRYNSRDGVLYGLRADLLIKQGKKIEAIELLKHAVKLESDYNWAWQTLISVGQKLDQPDIAKTTAQEITDKSPNLAAGWLARARLEAEDEKIIAYLNKGLEKDPKSVALHKELISNYLKQRDFAAAEQQINDTVWQSNIPITINVLHADSLSKQGRY